MGISESMGGCEVGIPESMGGCGLGISSGASWVSVDMRLPIVVRASEVQRAVVGDVVRAPVQARRMK